MAEAVGVRTVRSGSHLERMLASGIFAVTAEIAPPASADPTDIREIVSRYRGAVDACNVTDCTRARVHLSSLAAATIALREGIEPVMPMVARDRGGSVPRVQGGVVRKVAREGPRRRGFRPDAGRLRHRRVRGMDAPRAEGMAPREGLHPRGGHPLEVRQDGALLGRDARGHGPE